MNGKKDEKRNGRLILRFVKGILDSGDYLRLKENTASFSADCTTLILNVDKNDAETLAEMVTPAAFFTDSVLTDAMLNGEEAVHMLKKTAVAARRILSRYKLSAKNGGAAKEVDCRLSIITPSAHIHLPENVSDKKYERCVRECLLCACRLEKDGKHDMLVLCGENGAIRTESKEDYVRRVYGNAVYAAESEKEENAGQKL